MARPHGCGVWLTFLSGAVGDLDLTLKRGSKGKKHGKKKTEGAGGLEVGSVLRFRRPGAKLKLKAPFYKHHILNISAYSMLSITEIFNKSLKKSYRMMYSYYLKIFL